MIDLAPVPQVDTITKDEFLREFKRPERPVVIRNLTRDWPAREKWTPAYLKELGRHIQVPLYDSKPSRDRKHQHAPAARMALSEYFELLERGENDLRLFFFNLLSEVPELTEDFSYPDIGLKFFKKLPVLFAGGKGAKVQMHFDIDLADIMLCHFGGRKWVRLFSPRQTRLMYRVPYSFSSLFDVKFDEPDFEKYPALRHLRGEIAELNHGDVLYMPPGYWHYVTYDDISFSMALRAFPRKPATLAKMLYNLAVLRTVEGFMRKTVGQPWNDHNERRAVERTHRALRKLESAAARG